MRTPFGEFHAPDGAHDCAVVMRPEDLQVLAGGVPGEVIGREYYGHDQVLLVRLNDGTEVRVRLAPHERLGAAGRSRSACVASRWSSRRTPATAAGRCGLRRVDVLSSGCTMAP